MSTAIAVTDETFEAEALKADKPVLVDFTADWCGPCKALAPHIDAIAAARGDSLKVVKVDGDKNPALLEKFGVRGFPTLLILRDGKVAGSRVGGAPKGEIEKWIDDTLAKTPGQAVSVEDHKTAAETQNGYSPEELVIVDKVLKGALAIALTPALAGTALLVTSGAAVPAAIGLAFGANILRDTYKTWNVKDVFNMEARAYKDAQQMLKAAVENPDGGKELSPLYRRIALRGADRALTLAAGVALCTLGGIVAPLLGAFCALAGGYGLYKSAKTAFNLASNVESLRHLSQDLKNATTVLKETEGELRAKGLQKMAKEIAFDNAPVLEDRLFPKQKPGPQL